MIEVRQKSNIGSNRHDSIDGPYYYVPVIDRVEQMYVAETEDMTLIIGLAIKYDGRNSQFPKFAARMLGIKSEWSK